MSKTRLAYTPSTIGSIQGADPPLPDQDFLGDTQIALPWQRRCQAGEMLYAAYSGHPLTTRTTSRSGWKPERFGRVKFVFEIGDLA
jgi:hypothetical protein